MQIFLFFFGRTRNTLGSSIIHRGIYQNSNLPSGSKRDQNKNSSNEEIIFQMMTDDKIIFNRNNYSICGLTVYVREMLRKTGKDITLKLQDICVSSLDDTKRHGSFFQNIFFFSLVVLAYRENTF